MKLLTTIPANAILRAQGTYEYGCNGAPTGVREPWRIDELSDGTLLIHVERDAQVFGTTILLAAVCEAPLAALSFRRVEILLTNQHTVCALYEFNGMSVTFTRTLNDEAPQRETFALPDNAVVAPLMRVFLGATIQQVAARGRGDSVPVLVPYLENPQDAERLLRPTFDLRRAIKLSDGSWQYPGERYDEQSQFWLDDDGLLLRYRFQQDADTTWEIALKNE